ncbi:hypothetical protein BKA65DRAFT_26792 [Rhexocercosporidium sp. MPI-PUGE-AT-0058]|nr:hypothetical protein BKA65DRAFT_26792 [Rhexocercosporidium sp. MPI-PUGE-AT-0058]
MSVHQSSTRRKSCVTCVRTKRRCDLRLPQCSRCTGRGSTCEYITPKEINADRGYQSPAEDQALSQANVLQVPDFLQTGLTISGELDEDISISLGLLPAVSSFPFPERMVIATEQMQFCISQFKKLVPDLVQMNKSPFIHHNSYQSLPPVAYQDLLGISAMYCQKSPQNVAMIFSMLDSRVTSLIESSKYSLWSAREYLVGVQALTMYQIIRLFDGDIRQRASAERQLGICELWTFQLSLASNNCSTGLGIENAYQTWLFAESARRTVLMSVMVQAMYSQIRDGFCTAVPLLATLPLSLNGALWNASEEVWWQSTLGFGGELVTYGDFSTKWDGSIQHTDTFETILLAACRHNIRQIPIMSR